MKILVCPDSFKGSLSADEAADIIADEILQMGTDHEVIKIPLSDGGEGTMERIRNFYDSKEIIRVTNAAGKNIETEVLISQNSDGTKKCFIESAKIIGLPMLSQTERNPLTTTTFGLGEAIKTMAEKGCAQIIVSLGGSVTCDGGMGMLDALGFRFYDKTGKELEGRGKNLGKIYEIDDANSEESLKGINFTILCDVNNPLLGEEGAAKVFGPQKGATVEDVEILENGMANFFRICLKNGFCDEMDCRSRGAGAAGGLGFAFSTFLNAKVLKGIEYILEINDFEQHLKGTDLIITGEGKADSQSLMGKVLSGLISRTQNSGIDICVVAGKVKDTEELLENGVGMIYEMSDPKLSEEKNMEKEIAQKNLRRTIRQALKDVLITKGEIERGIIQIFGSGGKNL